MRLWKPCLFPAVVVLTVGFSNVRPADAVAKPDDLDEQFIRDVGMKADQASLLAYLQKRSGDHADVQRTEALVRQLASDNFQVREQAAKGLAGLGPTAVSVLRPAQTSPEAEIASRCRARLQEIEADVNLDISLHVVRLLVRRHHEGCVEPLLRFLPFAADEEVEEEICFALDRLVRQSGQVPPAVLAALEDALPARRAIAAFLVARYGNAEQRAAAVRHLADPHAMVRLRAAHGLLQVRDPASVPVLIDLLKEAAVELSWQAEELLHWLAGDSAPSKTVGASSDAERQACHDAWQE